MRILLFIMIFMSACAQHDLGTSCDASNPISVFEVSHEVTGVETITLSRSSECESLLCVQIQSASPYCTRTCTQSCPNGFVCRTLDWLDLTNHQRYCVRQS